MKCQLTLLCSCSKLRYNNNYVFGARNNASMEEYNIFKIKNEKNDWRKLKKSQKKRK